MGGQRPELGTYGAPCLLLPSTQGTEYPVGAQQIFKELQRKKAASSQSSVLNQLVEGFRVTFSKPSHPLLRAGESCRDCGTVGSL